MKKTSNLGGKTCYNCSRWHNSNITIAGGWPVCSGKCKKELDVRLERWLS